MINKIIDRIEQYLTTPHNYDYTNMEAEIGVNALLRGWLIQLIQYIKEQQNEKDKAA